MVTSTSAARVIPLSEARRRLGISRTTGHNWIRRGQWPTPLVRLANRWYVPIDDLERHLAGQPSTSIGEAA